MVAHLCARAAAAAVPSCSGISHSGSGRVGADSRQSRPLRCSQLALNRSDRYCTCSRGSLAASASQKEREAAPSGGDSKEPEQQEQQQGGMFQNLAASLLRGAASRLDDRGPTTCLKCRGTGTVTCTACKGHGVLGKSQVRMKTTGRVSNRCSKCGGSGRTTCTVCKGRGFRGDVFE